MFFAAFFGALFYAAVLGAVARRRRRQVFNKRDAVEGLPRTPGRATADARQPARRRLVRDHPGLRPAGDQHRDPADLGRDHHDRAPRAARENKRAILASSSRRPSCWASCSSACRPGIPPRLHRARPGFHRHHGSTFFMLTGFHGLRHDRRDHAAGDLAAHLRQPLHAEAPLRVRGGRLVLALRRRGLARPVRVRLLGLIAR